MENNTVFRHQSSIPPTAEQSKKWTLPLSVTILWVGTSFIAIATKCLQTNKQCTRWGPKHGSGFAHPLTIAAANLSIVGICLLLLLVLRDVVVARRSPQLFSWNKIYICLPVGIAFGLKVVIGLAALRDTPTEIYMLFHATNILFIAMAAWIMVGEKPTCLGEILALFGIAVGSVLSMSKSFFGSTEDSTPIGLMAFLLNMTNGIFAGLVVATLRWTTLQMKTIDISIAEITNLQILIAAAFVLPLAFLHDGTVIFSLHLSQFKWLFISSSIMLIYHLALSLVCALTSSLTVGIIEAIKPLPAFIVVAIVKQVPKSDVWFWLGTLITLASSVYFKVSRTIHMKGLRRSGSRQSLLGGK